MAHLLPVERRLNDMGILEGPQESHPLEMAEYAVAQDIQHEPAFNWWVPQVLRLRACIISLVKKRKMSYLKKNMKFGIEVPTSVDHALEIDKTNGNTFWAGAIAKEMKDVCIAFQCLNDGDRAPIGYKWIKCHMILTSKSRTSAGRLAWLRGDT